MSGHLGLWRRAVCTTDLMTGFSVETLSRGSIYRSSCSRCPPSHTDRRPAHRQRPARLLAVPSRCRPVREVRARRRVQHAAHAARLHLPAEGRRHVVPGGVGDRLHRGGHQRLSAQPPLDLPRARRRRAHAGALGDRRRAAAWRVNEGLLYVFVHDAHLEKILAQVAATVVVTITHLPRQPRVDLPRPLPASLPSPAAPRGAERAAPAADAEGLSGRPPAARARRGCARRGRSRAASSDERALEQPVEAARGAPTDRGSTRSSCVLKRSSTRSRIATGSSSELK